MEKCKQKTVILIILILFYNLAQAKNYTITLTGEIAKSISAKEITVWYWEDLIDRRDPVQERKTIKADIINGKFKITIHPQKSSIYMNFGLQSDIRNSVNQLNTYLFTGESRDEVFIKIDSENYNYKYTFSGFGSAKYNCAQELSVAFNNFKPTNLIVRDGNPTFEFRYQKDYYHELINEQFMIVEKYKKELSTYSFELYKTDVLYNVLYFYVRQLSFIKSNKSHGKELQSLLLDEIDWISNFEEKLNLSFNAKTIAKSAFLPLALVNLALIRADLSGTRVEDIIFNVKNPLIRDRMLTQYFLRFSKKLYPEIKENLYNQIMIVINDLYCRTIIDTYYKNTAVGMKAYNFQLPDTSGKIVRLSDFKGKIVFIDFWFVGCGGCAEYYRDIVKPVELKYKNVEGVVFISVSIDTDLEKWTKGIKSGNYTSEEIINLQCPDGARNPIIKQFAITGYPHPLIIDRDGNIFSDSTLELRNDGIEGLVNALEKALNKNEVRTAF